MANISGPGNSVYSPAQRAFSLTLGVACSIPLTSSMAIANVQLPTPVATFQNHASTVASAAHNYSAVHNSHLAATHVVPLALHTPVASTGALNLASSALSYIAGNLANFSSLTIDVGGKTEQVGLNTRLTAAEVVAVEQVITGGSGSAQTIAIGANGAASGGKIALNNGLLTALDNSVGGSISSLTIAHGVQVVDSVSSLSLSGGLANYGSILTAATGGGSTDTISAGTIVNAAGASIGSYGGGSGLVGADASLAAAASITNNGTIASAGNLILSAPVVTNSGAHALISAGQNVNFNTQSLNNTALVSATAGNVNVASTSALAVTGNGGTLQANNGNVNFSSNNADINVTGGNVLSQQVNLNAGTGNINAQMGNVTGLVNAAGNNIHVGAETANLNLGDIDAAADPTITNTGNLSISGNIAVANGADLALIAGGNITSASANGGIDTSAAGGGGNISLIAGVTFTTTPTGTGNQTATGETTVTKASANGGIIDLTGGNGGSAPVPIISSAGTAGNANGGNIQMIAFAGKTAGSGSIITPTGLTIDALGSGTGTNGTVTLIGGAKSGDAVSVGNISASTVTVSTSTPVITPAKGGKGVVFDPSGNQSAGTFTASKTPNAASIVLGNVDATTDLVISTGGGAAITNTSSALNLGTVTLGKTGGLVINDSAAGNINVGGIITGGSTTIADTGSGVLTQSGSGSINTTSLSFNMASTAGTNNVTTDVSSLVLVSAGSNININQGANTLAVSGPVKGNGTLVVNSTGQVNVNNLLSVNNTSITINTTGKGGINVAAPISVGTGSIILDNSGKGLITQVAGNPLTAPTISITDSTNLGTSKVPFQTSAGTSSTPGSLTVNNTGAKNITYVSDGNTGTVTFNGTGVGATAGGSIFLTSVANKLDVNSANYVNVSLTDNVVGSTGIAFTPTTATNFGTGTGTFTVTSVAAITGNANTNLLGTTVNLNGATGVGTAGQAIGLQSPNLVLNSATGSVYADDSLAATVNGSSSLNSTAKFAVNDSGAGNSKTGISLTVGKAVGGGNIDLTTSTPTVGTAGSIAVTGTLGTVNSNSVTLTSVTGISTKGAISGAKISATANGGVLAVGGNVGGLGSVVSLTTTGAPTDVITVGGVVTGYEITVDSVSTVTTTKAITAVGSGGALPLPPVSTVLIEGAATASNPNAVVIGAAVSGLSITAKQDAGATGNIVVNANVGGLTTSTTVINASTGTSGQTISGKGIIGGQTVTLDATGAIGTNKASVQTQAVNLSVNTGAANVGGSFIAQKGNVTIGVVNTDNLVLKVTGSTDVLGTITAPSINLSTSGTTAIDGTITSGAATTGTVLIASTGAFTSNNGSSITSSGEPVTINVANTANINGSITVAHALNLTTTGLLTIGSTGSVVDGTDNISSKGGITVGGQLGNGTDVFNISTTGAFTVGFPTAATVNGTGTVSALSVANYGTIQGTATYTATGTGNAFANYGTLGVAADTITINAAKGAIVSGVNSTINAGNLALTGASANLDFAGVTDISSANITGAFNVIATGTGLTVGGTGSTTVFNVGSANIQYVNVNAGNANTVTVNSIAAKTGNLTVSSNARNLTVGAASNLTTVAGNITLQNTNTNAAAKIVVDDGTTIHGSGGKTALTQGNVYIFMGPAGFTPSAGTPPSAANATVGGSTPAQVTFASTANPTGSITAVGTGSTLNSSARNLEFSTGTLPSTAIQIGSTTGGVTITADPPAGGVSAQLPTFATAAATIPVTSASSSMSSLPTAEAVNGVSSGISFAPINNVSIATMTLANPTLGAGFFSGLNSGVTAQNTIENIAGESSLTASNSGLTGVSNATVGSASGKTLSGQVSNTAHRNLERGPLLLLPEQNTVVETPFGSVNVAANSVALIIASDNGLAVYNMHDAHKNAVTISGKGSPIAVAPGRSAVLAKSSVRSFEEVNPAPFVGYRAVSASAVSDSKLYQTEFDMMSMVRGLPALKHLLTSENASTRKTMSNMLKTAAILMQISQSSEAYSLYLTPAKTAFLSSAQR